MRALTVRNLTNNEDLPNFEENSKDGKKLKKKKS